MTEFPHTFIDQMMHEVRLSAPPKRIISLVPSQTELLFDLGLNEEIVGITKFCIHPDEWFRHKTRIGGTKQYHFDKIALLEPDLIIGNKEENDEEQIHELQKLYPVWMSDIHNLDEALEMILHLGTLTGKAEKAQTIAGAIKTEFDLLDQDMQSIRTLNAAYLIWKNPYMGAGHHTFIDSMLHRLHMVNVLADGRYPETTLADLKERSPEVVLLSSEPYPFKEQHIQEIKSVLPDSVVLLVDGEMFSWYGSRLLKAPDYFRSVITQLSEATR